MATLVSIEIPSVTNLPRDSVNNTFALDHTGSLSAAERTAISGPFARFFTATTVTVSASVGEFLSPSCSRAANVCNVRQYDITGHLDGSPHGSPVDIHSFTLPGSGSSTGLPSEVACVMRLEAEGRAIALTEVPDGSDTGSANDRPKQRHTGRVFIGPLHTGAIVMTSGIPRVSDACKLTILDAGARLVSELHTVRADLELSVWSRKDGALRPLESIAVDNAFDTQRRRGERATALTRVTV